MDGSRRTRNSKRSRDLASMGTGGPTFKWRSRLGLCPVKSESVRPVEVRNNDSDVVSHSCSTNKVNVVGASLANLGNTCFVNAVLQCFMHIVPFLKTIMCDVVSSDCRCDNNDF